MKKFNILNSLTRTFYRTGFKFKKHSPEVLVVAGAAAMVAGTVSACIATSKVKDVVAKEKNEIENVRKIKDDPELAEVNHKKLLAATYAKAGYRIARLYAPSVALTVTGIGLIFKSHNILSKRNIALAAAYTAIDNDFKGYRKRVVDRFGEELDRELRYDIKSEEVEETVVDEKGKKKKVKKIVQTAGAEDPSEFAKCFDVGCIGWTKDPESNMTFLRLQQNIANEILQRKGYLFLNEVYDMFGFPHTAAGQVTGWIYRPNDPTYAGDGYVNFNIYNINQQANKDFVNGKERSIWLDFNVDGPIWNLIDKD